MIRGTLRPEPSTRPMVFAPHPLLVVVITRHVLISTTSRADVSQEGPEERGCAHTSCRTSLHAASALSSFFFTRLGAVLLCSRCKPDMVKARSKPYSSCTLGTVMTVFLDGVSNSSSNSSSTTGSKVADATVVAATVEQLYLVGAVEALVRTCLCIRSTDANDAGSPDMI